MGWSWPWRGRLFHGAELTDALDDVTGERVLWGDFGRVREAALGVRHAAGMGDLVSQIFVGRAAVALQLALKVFEELFGAFPSAARIASVRVLRLSPMPWSPASVARWR